MSLEDGWRSTGQAERGSGSKGWTGRPSLGLSDVVLQLWRTKWLMLLVFLPIFILSIIAAFMFPVEYGATSRIKVSLGSEDVFNPVVGPGTGAVPDTQEVVEGEIELLKSPVIAERVLDEIGLANLYPDLAKELEEAAPDKRYVVREKGVIAVQEDFTAWAPPKNPVIRTSFSARDPRLAANTLNTLVATYLDYRAELFASADLSPLTRQREEAERKLLQADEAIQRFLVENSIGDFDTEKTSISGLYANITDQLFQVQAQTSETSGRLAALRVQLSVMEPEVDLFVETNTDQAILDLELEREDLLAKYKPDSKPVQAIDARIAKAKQFIAAQTEPKGVTRRGLNETYLALDQSRAELAAELGALNRRTQELLRQKTDIERRQRRLTQLEPRYQELLREQAIVENQVRSLTIREEEERVKQDVLRSDFDNIQVLEPARPPAKGSSLRRPIAAAGLLFAAFTALIVGLLRSYTRDTFSTANSVVRTTGLPVLTSVGRIRG